MTEWPRHLNTEIRAELLQLLLAQGTPQSVEERSRFVDQVEHSIRWSRTWRRRLRAGGGKGDLDIVRLARIARDRGDRDEAIWRAFLAAHFGRASASPGEELSAGHLLCAFEQEPYWTWSAVTSRDSELETWLKAHEVQLRTLKFGNHRKHESKKPDVLYGVLSSFVDFGQALGGSPLSALTFDAQLTPAERFGVAYVELTSSLRRFGRLGVFDFLVLLRDLDLVELEPDGCYLEGSTGPLQGARRLWGHSRRVRELERLAMELSACAGVGPEIVEDALCNWNK